MKYGSELKSQQIEACNSDINRLTKEVISLLSSLQEKEAAAAQLQNELQKRQQIASTQLLEFIKLRAQIAELELRLQEVEYQKQQAELEMKAAVQEMEARRNLEAQLYAQLGEQWISSVYLTSYVQHMLFVLFRWTTQGHLPTHKPVQSFPRKSCLLHCPSYWIKTSQLPLAVEASGGGR